MLHILSAHVVHLEQHHKIVYNDINDLSYGTPLAYCTGMGRINMKTTKTLVAALVLTPLMMLIGCGSDKALVQATDLSVSPKKCAEEATIISFEDIDDEAREEYDVSYRLYCAHDEAFTKETATIKKDASSYGTELIGLAPGTYYCAVAATEEVNNLKREEGPLSKEKKEVVIAANLPTCLSPDESVPPLCTPKTCDEMGVGFIGDDGCGTPLNCVDAGACVATTTCENGGKTGDDDGCGVVIECTKLSLGSECKKDEDCESTYCSSISAMFKNSPRTCQDKATYWAEKIHVVADYQSLKECLGIQTCNVDCSAEKYCSSTDVPEKWLSACIETYNDEWLLTKAGDKCKSFLAK